jgi:AcrR family transcriptional regulator
MESAAHQTESFTAAQERILDAAEAAFSEHGFGGVGMKAIAQSAGVAQGLIHYHFGTKDGLYAAVIARRSSLINAGRQALLDAVPKDATDRIERIFDALFRPPLGEEGGGKVYARIFAGLAVGGARDQALVQEHYDPIARKFIAALQDAAPGASKDAIAWAYTFAIGMLIASVSRDGRRERLAARTPDETEDIIQNLTTHAAAGLRGLIEKDQG